MSESTDILALSPTAYWPLNDAAGSTSAADATGNGHAAAKTGTVTFGVSASQAGDSETGAQGAASSSVLTAPASTAWVIGTANFTAAIWVKFTTLPSGTTVLMGHAQGASGGTISWYLGLNTSGNAIYAMGSNSATPGASALNDGNFHLIVLRRTSGALSLSVDAVTQGGAGSTFSTSLGTSAEGFGVLNFNADSTLNSFGFLGVAKKAFFVNGTAISDSSITTLYNDATTAGSSLSAGTLSAGSVTSSSASLSIATNTGGTTPYSSQLKRSAHGAGSYSNIGSPVAGATPSFTDSTVSASTSYDYKVTVTDSAGTPATADSNVVNVVTAAGTTTIAVTDANWLHPPGTYGNGGGAMQANRIPASSTVAAYLTPSGEPARLKVTSTGNLALNVDVSRTSAASVTSGNYPILTYSLDDGAWTDVQLTSSTTSIAVLSSGTVGTHELLYKYKAGYTSTNKWTGAGSPSIPPAAIVVTGATVDSGGATTTPSYVPSGVDLVEGDSITEGLRVINTTDAPTGNDAAFAFPSLLSRAFGSSVWQRGYGATGYEASGQGSVPSFPSNYGLYFAATSRLSSGQFVTQPDRIWVAHGTNGTTTQADVATMITNLRTAAPSAWIFVCVPPGGFARAAITAAVTAAADAKVKKLDAGTSFQAGLTAIGSGTAEATDGLHPRALTHAQYAAILVQQAQGYFGGTATYAAPADVRLNVDRGDGTLGTYDPITGNYTDPGAAHVQSGQTYRFAGATLTGTLSGGTVDVNAIAAAVASAVLVNPSNKLSTDANGRTTLTPSMLGIIARASSVVHVPPTGNDVTNGTNLIAAAAAASAGTLVVGDRCTYDCGATPQIFPDGVSFLGAGIGATFIKSAVDLNAAGVCVKIGSNAEYADFTILCNAAAGTYQAPIGFDDGFTGQTVATNWTLRRIRTDGDSDGLYMRTRFGTTFAPKVRGLVYDCRFESKGDSSNNVMPNGSLWDFGVDYYGTTLSALGPSATTFTQARAINLSAGLSRLFGCTLVARNGSVSSYAASIKSNTGTTARVELYDTQAYVSTSTGTSAHTSITGPGTGTMLCVNSPVSVSNGVAPEVQSNAIAAAPTVAAAILTTPSNKLATNGSGQVTATNGGGGGGNTIEFVDGGVTTFTD